ncbi:hypothetical protein COV23_00435 [Candidatus Wolfebacteria bacterium CG10_big_fil_rev_8_21_14_0_10_31_9]|uniref:Zinc-ribbon domain-containing protein n=1 Tax=Candidatus Wolfebacteria bacterium CG10_big_fil_rev_8_21_14_0_10_31_9 TaxID=1975070 RepID=A0A2H0RE66_9BACT|nr:MAG: hypothetical protein COV23_00435 [Candidatus Wolfebacteria bacterium CG10_big_fil_rev_8_21_14_0_10_31_9]
MENILPEITCSSCHSPISAIDNFCSQCGKKIKEPPFSISVGKQIFVYFISFFLAPFGLAFAFKYLKLPDSKARKIGIIVIILTILSIATTIYISTVFTKFQYQGLDEF